MDFGASSEKIDRYAMLLASQNGLATCVTGGFLHSTSYSLAKFMVSSSHQKKCKTFLKDRH